MFKGLFLCVLLAALSAQSMAQPEASADEEEMNERVARGVFGLLAKAALKGASKLIPHLLPSRQQREANDLDLRSAEELIF
ncbi:hypothetical protein XENTR_v10016310 [Xenopus tropicalis]|uniref:Preprocaerulein type-3-like n=1 Tax=Xenopus tropicalis TaxID=8364 RepID=A0A8J1JR30_XENTR|nr:preprocaerulein type-3-like [Xenopus tropicalis]KAE8596982.1 hypothetical protein XENTR_v10016310 [Xenopus tropicalis]